MYFDNCSVFNQVMDKELTLELDMEIHMEVHFKHWPLIQPVSWWQIMIQ